MGFLSSPHFPKGPSVAKSTTGLSLPATLVFCVSSKFKCGRKTAIYWVIFQILTSIVGDIAEVKTIVKYDSRTLT